MEEMIRISQISTKAPEINSAGFIDLGPVDVNVNHIVLLRVPPTNMLEGCKAKISIVCTNSANKNISLFFANEEEATTFKKNLMNAIVAYAQIRTGVRTESAVPAGPAVRGWW